MSKATRKLIYGNDLETKIYTGLKQAYCVAKAAYGPAAGNAFIEQQYGDPLVSRDGVTNLEKVYLEDPIENMAARSLVQSSRKNNKKVGDGTTAVAILAFHLYKEARKLIGSGYNRMQVSRMLEATATEVIKQIETVTLSVKDNKLLKHVAVVSSGDEAIGHMIADIIAEVGIDGGVTVEDFAGIGIYNELVDGFYFRKGFTNVNLITDPTNLESRHENVHLLITEKRLALPTDIEPILEQIVANGIRELVIVGDVSEEALGSLLLNRLKGVITTTVVDVPVFGALRSLLMEDLAVMTGGNVFVPGAKATDFTVDMLGAAGKIIVNEFSTTIIDGDGSKEDVEVRVKDLHAQLLEADSQVTIEALKDRLSKLTGKVAIIRVGGATELEQGEVKLRVQDAICAVQAAIKEGIVPGGGVTLARVKAEHFQEAFQQPFKQLVNNAGYNTDRALWNVLEAPGWRGYDLRNFGDSYKPVDLLKAGIIDPSSVIKEVVRNATSIVSKLVTVSVGITYNDREQKYD